LRVTTKEFKENGGNSKYGPQFHFVNILGPERFSGLDFKPMNDLTKYPSQSYIDKPYFLTCMHWGYCRPDFEKNTEVQIILIRE